MSALKQLSEEVQDLNQKFNTLSALLTVKVTVSQLVEMTRGALTAKQWRRIILNELGGTKPGGKVLMVEQGKALEYLTRNPVLSEKEVEEIIENA